MEERSRGFDQHDYIETYGGKSPPKNRSSERRMIKTYRNGIKNEMADPGFLRGVESGGLGTWSTMLFGQVVAGRAEEIKRTGSDQRPDSISENKSNVKDNKEKSKAEEEYRNRVSCGLDSPGGSGPRY